MADSLSGNASNENSNQIPGLGGMGGSGGGGISTPGGGGVVAGGGGSGGVPDYVDLHELAKGWKAAIGRAKDPLTRYVHSRNQNDLFI